jgi:hypothetical protein
VLVPERSDEPLLSVSTTSEHTTSSDNGAASAQPKCAQPLHPLRLPPRPKVCEQVTSGHNAKSVTPSQEPTKNSPFPNRSEVSTPEAPFQPRLFLKNLREGLSLIVEGVESYVKNEKLSSTTKVITLGGSVVTVLGAFTCGVPQGLGALSFVLAKLGDNLAENKHSRAYAAVTGSALSAHFTALGDNALAVNSETFAGRMLIQSMIPESRRHLTLAVTTVGVGLSAYLFCSSPGFVAEISLRNAPLFATVLHGFAGALPSNRSALTRLANLTCSAWMLPFHCFVSGSGFFAALSAVYAYGSIKNIRKHDLKRWIEMGKATKPKENDAETTKG